jgi:hypothetical protein
MNYLINQVGKVGRVYSIFNLYIPSCISLSRAFTSYKNCSSSIPYS